MHGNGMIPMIFHSNHVPLLHQVLRSVPMSGINFIVVTIKIKLCSDRQAPGPQVHRDSITILFYNVLRPDDTAIVVSLNWVIIIRPAKTCMG